VAVAGGCGCVAFIIYLFTLAPSLPTGDSGELITAAKLLGVAHAPGYPLFTMLGHLFTLLPFGSVAYRVNLMSAVFDALAVAVIALSTYRLVIPATSEERRPGGTRWPAACAAAAAGLILGFGGAFWATSVIAEVFALDNFLAALLLFLLLEWERRPRRAGFLYAAGLVAGLGMANQQTIVLLAPACLLLLVSGVRRLRRERPHARIPAGEIARQIGGTVVLFSVGLLPYLYLPLAARTNPALNWGDPRTLPAFVRVVTRADFGSLRLFSASGSGGSPVLMFLGSLFDGFTPLGCALVLLGAWWFWKRRRAQGLALALAFLLTGPIFLVYAGMPTDQADVVEFLQRFWVLPMLCLAPLAGAGVFQVLGWLARPALARERWPLPALGVALLLVPIGSLLVHYSAADQSHNWLDYYLGRDMLAAFDQNSLFLVQGDLPSMSTDYQQLVEGYRRDVVTLDMLKLGLPFYVRQMRRQHPGVAIPLDSYSGSGNELTQLIDANLPSRSVYLLGTTPDASFNDRFDVQRAGFVAKVVPKGNGSDPYAVEAAQLDLFERAHYPTTLSADTTYDWVIDQAYGQLAFDVGYVLDQQKQANHAADFYRSAITLEPSNALAYRNLGQILYDQGQPASAIAPLWDEYLSLAPGDDQAAAIQQKLSRLNQPR